MKRKIQIRKPTKDDWRSEVLQDLKELNIEYSLDEIGNMTKEKLKKSCKNQSIQQSIRVPQQ